MAPAAAPAPPSAAPSAPQPAESGLGLAWYLVIGVLIALALFFFVRRRKEV